MPEDGKDKVLIWPGGEWHRCDLADPAATDRAIADNDWDYSILWFPKDLSDEELDLYVHHNY